MAQFSIVEVAWFAPTIRHPKFQFQVNSVRKSELVCFDLLSNSLSQRSGSQRQTDNCGRAFAPSSGCNVYHNGCGLQRRIIANLSDFSPAQIWHVGARKDSDVTLVCNLLVKGYILPFDSSTCAGVGKFLFRGNRASCTPHVLLAKGSKFNHSGPGRRVLLGVVRDWLRALWPIVVYVKNRKGCIHDGLGPILISFGSVGHSLPVCSCVVSLGVHNEGKIYTN